MSRASLVPLIWLVLPRLMLGAALLVAVSMVLFLGVELLPGNFAESYLGQSATPEAVANLTAELGLDRPVVARYFEWLLGAIRGDFGISWATRGPVSAQILPRLENTLLLASAAALISVPAAIGLGILAVQFVNRWPDRLANILSLGAISLPEFFIGYIMIYVVAVQLRWVTFPSTVYPGMSITGYLEAVALPCATLVLVVLAYMMRMTRAAILNVMSSPYIETAELKGLSALKVITRHAAPNAVAPIVNVVALNLAYLIVGVVVVEVIFVFPGIGQYMVDAVAIRDLPVVQACGLIFASVYIGLNTIADVIAIVANPRLRHPR